MISNLLDHSADMIAASLTMSGERFEVVDYLPPIGMETYTIVIKAVDSEEISWLTFKRPLRYETWIFMVALALIFTFTIHLSGKLLMMENKTGLEVNEHFMNKFDIRFIHKHTICFSQSVHQSDNLLYDLQCYARLLGYAHWGSSPSFVRYTYIFKISR